jgi:hypothetical protein
LFDLGFELLSLEDHDTDDSSDLSLDGPTLLVGHLHSLLGPIEVGQNRVNGFDPQVKIVSGGAFAGKIVPGFRLI